MFDSEVLRGAKARHLVTVHLEAQATTEGQGDLDSNSDSSSSLGFRSEGAKE